MPVFSTSDSHNLEVSYLTNNLKWKADYVVVLDSTDDNAELSGWVTVDNKSGTTYKDAKLKLVAGDVNRVREMFREKRMHYEGMVMAKGMSQFEEKEFFEYHIYDLNRKTELKNNQTKQISLLEAGNINIMKEFVVSGNKKIQCFSWYSHLGS